MEHPTINHSRNLAKAAISCKPCNINTSFTASFAEEYLIRPTAANNPPSSFVKKLRVTMMSKALCYDLLKSNSGKSAFRSRLEHKYITNTATKKATRCNNSPIPSDIHSWNINNNLSQSRQTGVITIKSPLYLRPELIKLNNSPNKQCIQSSRRPGMTEYINQKARKSSSFYLFNLTVGKRKSRGNNKIIKEFSNVINGSKIIRESAKPEKQPNKIELNMRADSLNDSFLLSSSKAPINAKSSTKKKRKSRSRMNNFLNTFLPKFTYTPEGFPEEGWTDDFRITAPSCRVYVSKPPNKADADCKLPIINDLNSSLHQFK